MSFLLALFIFPLGPQQQPNTKAKVFVSGADQGFKLIRNGNAFKIRGASGSGHIKELAAYGGNTLRVYDTTNLNAVLEEAEKYGISIIVDIPLLPFNEKYNSYKDGAENEKLKEGVRRLVKRFRHHPALLVWNLGNEVEYPLVFSENNFIRTFNELIDLIHKEDPDHPVSTAVTFPSKREIISIGYHSPELDLIGFNVFGNIKNLDFELSKMALLLRPFPFYISEWGHDGPWEVPFTKWDVPIEPTSTKKMDQLRERYHLLMSQGKANNLGTLTFYWGQKLESTPTWFSTFLNDSTKSEVLRTLDHLWKNTKTPEAPIGLNYMLIDGLGAPSNLVFPPGQKKIAKLVFLESHSVKLDIHWEVYREAWDLRKWGEDEKSERIQNAVQLATGDSVIFRTPTREGPYRIFAYVYDSLGYAATANIPFYVLNETHGR
jgi:hypothetical protein